MTTSLFGKSPSRLLPAAVLVMALAVMSGCGGSRVIIDVPGPRGPSPRGPAPPATGDVIDVKEVRADYVGARVIYAKEVHAADGWIGSVCEEERGPEGRGRGDRGGGGGGELKTHEVVADTIYAKEIHAGYLEADYVCAREVKVGRR